MCENDLKPDEVLLEYVLDDPNSYCVSVSRQGAYVRVLPTGRKEIEKLAQQFVDEIRAKGAGARTFETTLPSALEADPRSERQRHDFIIAPDGILNLLPFEALRDNQGEYLLKSRIISYVPSGTILEYASPSAEERNRAEAASRP